MFSLRNGLSKKDIEIEFRKYMLPFVLDDRSPANTILAFVKGKAEEGKGNFEVLYKDLTNLSNDILFTFNNEWARGLRIFIKAYILCLIALKDFNAKRTEVSLSERYDAVDDLGVIYDEFIKIESSEII